MAKEPSTHGYDPRRSTRVKIEYDHAAISLCQGLVKSLSVISPHELFPESQKTSKAKIKNNSPADKETIID